jgi:voltage-gated potassium channel Kch
MPGEERGGTMDGTTTTMTASGAAPPGTDQTLPAQSSMYELFMGLLTIMSLGVMVMLLLARQPAIEGILTGVDTLFCLIFLVDFGRSLSIAPSKRDYLLGERPGRSFPHGLTDLLGSIPSVGIFRAFRVFRLARVARIVRAKGAASLAREFVERRAESAVYLIIVAALSVLLLGSIAIAYIEAGVEGANIKSGSDAFWWAFVTITTVGYGDRFPVTDWGRFVGMITMAVGIGIFGVLTSFLSATFMAPPKPQDGALPEPTMRDLADELSALRREVAELRAERTTA